MSAKNKTESRHAPLVERTKARRWKPGQSGNPNGRPRHKKFSDAMRQLLSEVNANGETNAEVLARHCFAKALGGSARHQELALSYVEGKPPSSIELSGPGGSSIGIANMTEAEIDARLAELLGSMTDAQLLARAARVFPAPATTIGTVAESVEIISAATPAQAPAAPAAPAIAAPAATEWVEGIVPASAAAPASKSASKPSLKSLVKSELSHEDRAKAFFDYTTGACVKGPAATPTGDWPGPTKGSKEK